MKEDKVHHEINHDIHVADSSPLVQIGWGALVDNRLGNPG